MTMFNAIRNLVAGPGPSRADNEGNDTMNANQLEAASSSIDAKPGFKPFGSAPVPLGVSGNPEDHQTIFGDIFEQVFFAPWEDGYSVVAYPATFAAESATGETFDEDSDYSDGDEDNPRTRVQYTTRVYDHLSTNVGSGVGQHGYPRLVNYLGRTNYGFRLERLNPGPMPKEKPHPHKDNRVLALYWRWALQALSAIVYLHAKGVILNGLSDQVIWLRGDYSVAISGLYNAGCAGLNIPGGSWGDTSIMSSNLKRPSSRSEDDCAETHAGTVKGDLFDWATWVWRLMSCGQDPTSYDLPDDYFKHEDLRRRCNERRQGIANGKESAFPPLKEAYFGRIVHKAWTGQYDDAELAMQELKETLAARGVSISGEYDDELIGYDWVNLVEVVRDGKGRNIRLQLRQDPVN